MNTLHYIGLFSFFFFISSCGFSWFPNQNEETNAFSNVYSAKYRKRPPNAAFGKCYEKYIKSPYKYSCRNRTHSFMQENYTNTDKFNIISNPKERIKHNNPLWVEVICEQYIHADFAERLNTRLIHAGFLNPKNIVTRRIIDFRTKAALTKYQRYYCLPQGTLNMETLMHLGL